MKEEDYLRESEDAIGMSDQLLGEIMRIFEGKSIPTCMSALTMAILKSFVTIVGVQDIKNLNRALKESLDEGVKYLNERSGE